MTLRIEHLNPRILTIRHEHIAVWRERQAVRVAEFAGAGPLFSPFMKKTAIAIEVSDPTVDVAVADVERAVRRVQHFRRLIEVRRIPAALTGGANSQEQATIV